MVPEAKVVSHDIPIVTSRGAPKRREFSPHNSRNLGKLCSWRTSLNLWHRRVYMRWNNSTTIKHVYNKSVNLIDNFDVAADTNDWWNHPKIVPVIGLESMVMRTLLHYTWDDLPPGICSLSMPAAMAKLISVNAKITIVVL